MSAQIAKPGVLGVFINSPYSQIFIFVAYIGLLVTTYVLVAKNFTGDDSQLSDTISKIGGLNAGITVVLIFLAFSFINANPTAKDKYLIFTTHIALFFSILAVSISALIRRTG